MYTCAHVWVHNMTCTRVRAAVGSLGSIAGEKMMKTHHETALMTKQKNEPFVGRMRMLRKRKYEWINQSMQNICEGIFFVHRSNKVCHGWPPLGSYALLQGKNPSQIRARDNDIHFAARQPKIRTANFMDLCDWIDTVCPQDKEPTPQRHRML